MVALVALVAPLEHVLKTSEAFSSGEDTQLLPFTPHTELILKKFSDG
jgi:hypothetical protein